MELKQAVKETMTFLRDDIEGRLPAYKKMSLMKSLQKVMDLMEVPEYLRKSMQHATAHYNTGHTCLSQGRIPNAIWHLGKAYVEGDAGLQRHTREFLLKALEDFSKWQGGIWND